MGVCFFAMGFISSSLVVLKANWSVLPLVESIVCVR